eukprot:COSAG01_NODE_9_length_43729_cov_66.133463_41_plen_1107_part_00
MEYGDDVNLLWQDSCRLAAKLWRSSQFLRSWPLRFRYLFIAFLIGRRSLLSVFVAMTDLIFRVNKLNKLSTAFPYAMFGFLAIFRWVLMRQLATFVLFDSKSSLKGVGNQLVVDYSLLLEHALGDVDVRQNLLAYQSLINQQHVKAFSVKLSAITCPVPDLSGKEKENRFVLALQQIADCCLLRFDPPLMTIDMENFADYDATIAAIKSVFMQEKYLDLALSIVIQSYLPQAYTTFKDLESWSAQRVSLSGRALRIRLVKGANLLVERQRSSVHAWPTLTYLDKVSSDSQFKKILYEWAISDKVHVDLVVASHNIFDLSFALVLRQRSFFAKRMHFELLYGMNNALIRVLQFYLPEVYIYTPILSQHALVEGVPYLIRRLDEQSSKGNFMFYAFSLKVGSAAWDHLKSSFLLSDFNVSYDRLGHHTPFEQWYLGENQCRAALLLEHKIPVKDRVVPALLSGKVLSCPDLKMAYSPNNLHEIVYTYQFFPEDLCDVLLKETNFAQLRWQELGFKERQKKIISVADDLLKVKNKFLALMSVDVAKPLQESDYEFGEAVDFCLFYARAAEDIFDDYNDISSKGLVLLLTPWNFPLAIPCGGIVSALLMGNAVIFKPAPESVAVAYELAQVFWRAGIPRDVLQFINCDEASLGKKILCHPDINHVMLTGATATAQQFLSWRPDLSLQAETGGKNSIIVTRFADLDLAISHILQSAFSFSGQKCSAASLLICEREVLENTSFLSRLKSAIENLFCGLSSDIDSQVVPMIRSDNIAFLQEAMRLEGGQSWLLPPQQHEGCDNLWTPGIKTGVLSSHDFYTQECFGPLLGVLCFDRLSEALHLANGTGYALTAGIQSLSNSEQNYFIQHIQAGNVYVNKAITGAMVGRQPFGGWKKSGFGLSVKAGEGAYLWTLVSNAHPNATYQKKLQSSEFNLLQCALCDIFNLQDYFSLANVTLNQLKLSTKFPACRGEENLYRVHDFDVVCIFAFSNCSNEDLAKVLGVVSATSALCYLCVPESDFLWLDDLSELYQGDIVCVRRSWTDTQVFSFLSHLKGRVLLRCLGSKFDLSQGRLDEACFEVDSSLVDVLPNKACYKYIRTQLISKSTERYGRLM